MADKAAQATVENVNGAPTGGDGTSEATMEVTAEAVEVGELASTWQEDISIEVGMMGTRGGDAAAKQCTAEGLRWGW